MVDRDAKMRFKPKIAIGVLGPALGLAAFTLALQLQVSAMPAVRGINPTPIDRTLKNDRLPLPAAVGVPQRSQEPRLPEGCVDAAGWHRNTIYTAEVAGRCVG